VHDTAILLTFNFIADQYKYAYALNLTTPCVLLCMSLISVYFCMHTLYCNGYIKKGTET